MPEILTESFCERCGTKYSLEPEAEKRPGKGLKRARVLARGLKNFVLSEDPLEDAFAAAEIEEDREAAGAQLDAFHRVFNFCMECRQYTCQNCWNADESRCLSCAPVPGRYDPLLTVTQGSPLPSLADALGYEPIGNGSAPALDALVWPSTDLGGQPSPLGWPPVDVGVAGAPAQPAPDGSVPTGLDAYTAWPATDDIIRPEAAPETESPYAAAAETVEAPPELPAATPIGDEEFVYDATADRLARYVSDIAAEPEPQAVDEGVPGAVAGSEPVEPAEPDALAGLAAFTAEDVLARLGSLAPPEPVAEAAPEPVVAEPEPVAEVQPVTPEPVIPEPVAAAPQPVAPGVEEPPFPDFDPAWTFEPSASELPPPIELEAEAPAAAPAPVEPEPVVAVQPEPVAAEPVVAQPEPEPAEAIDSQAALDALLAQHPVAEQPQAIEPPAQPVYLEPEPELAYAAEPQAEPAYAAESEQPVLEPEEPYLEAEPELEAQPQPTYGEPEPEYLEHEQVPVQAEPEPEPELGGPSLEELLTQRTPWPAGTPDVAPPAAAEPTPVWPPQAPVYQPPPAPVQPAPAVPPVVSVPPLAPQIAAQQVEQARAAGAPQASRVWDESSRNVLERPGAGAGVGVQSCVSCGLSLSASARFCRRCGTRQA